MALNPDIFPSKLDKIEIKENNYSIAYTKEGTCTFSSIKGKSEIASTFPDLLYKKNIVGFLDYKRFDSEKPTEWDNDYNLEVQVSNMEKTDSSLVFSGTQNFYLIKPPAFRSFIFYGTVTSGKILFDGRMDNTSDRTFAGFDQSMAISGLVNTSNIIVEGNKYEITNQVKYLPLNKSSYYLEFTKLSTFPYPAFTTNDVPNIRSVGNMKALVLYDVALTEKEVQENIKKLDEYYS